MTMCMAPRDELEPCTGLDIELDVSYQSALCNHSLGQGFYPSLIWTEKVGMRRPQEAKGEILD